MKERKNERTKERKNERTKERKNKRKKERKKERATQRERARDGDKKMTERQSFAASAFIKDNDSTLKIGDSKTKKERKFFF